MPADAKHIVPTSSMRMRWLQGSSTADDRIPMGFTTEHVLYDRPSVPRLRYMFLLHNHRATGSMRDVQYEVAAALGVEKVDEIDNTNNVDDSEGGVEVDTCRYVATRVIRAPCTCQAGAGGGCHHMCQLLQLTRLLQLTEVELEYWNPKSPTSVACQWGS